MSNYRKDEVLNAMDEALEKDLKANAIDRNNTPISKVESLIDDYFKERGAYFGELIEAFARDSNSLTADKQADNIKDLAVKTPNVLGYKKETDELLSQFTIAQRRDSGTLLVETITYLSRFYKEELTFYNRLYSGLPNLGALQGTLIYNNLELLKLQKSLLKKWDKKADSAKSINKRSKDQLGKVHDLITKNVQELRDELKKGENIIVEGIKKARDAAIESNFVTKAGDHLIKKLASIEQPIDELVPIFENHLKSFHPVCIMYKKTKEDVMDYLDKVGLEVTVQYYKDTLSNFKGSLSAFETRMQIEDASNLFKIIEGKLKEHLENFYDSNSLFIKSQDAIFLGALAPKHIEQLLDIDDFDDIIDDFEDLNLEKHLRNLIEDSVNTWFYDIDDLPPEREEELRKILNSQIRELKGILKVHRYDVGDKARILYENQKKKLTGILK